MILISIYLLLLPCSTPKYRGEIPGFHGIVKPAPTQGDASALPFKQNTVMGLAGHQGVIEPQLFLTLLPDTFLKLCQGSSIQHCHDGFHLYLNKIQLPWEESTVSFIFPNFVFLLACLEIYVCAFIFKSFWSCFKTIVNHLVMSYRSPNGPQITAWETFIYIWCLYWEEMNCTLRLSLH